MESAFGLDFGEYDEEAPEMIWIASCTEQREALRGRGKKISNCHHQDQEETAVPGCRKRKPTKTFTTWVMQQLDHQPSSLSQQVPWSLLSLLRFKFLKCFDTSPGHTAFRCMLLRLRASQGYRVLGLGPLPQLDHRSSFWSTSTSLILLPFEAAIGRVPSSAFWWVS